MRQLVLHVYATHQVEFWFLGPDFLKGKNSWKHGKINAVKDFAITLKASKTYIYFTLICNVLTQPYGIFNIYNEENFHCYKQFVSLGKMLSVTHGDELFLVTKRKVLTT